MRNPGIVDRLASALVDGLDVVDDRESSAKHFASEGIPSSIIAVRARTAQPALGALSLRYLLPCRWWFASGSTIRIHGMFRTMLRLRCIAIATPLTLALLPLLSAISGPFAQWTPGEQDQSKDGQGADDQPQALH